ncbi:hypothetical protein [Nocardia carnea]|uniref:hypothetical protein n=1 Tax=Nocardia carnea TaxID=37328 RepID=UPI003D7747B2
MGALALILLITVGDIHVHELITGLIGVAVIGAAVLASNRPHPPTPRPRERTTRSAPAVFCVPGPHRPVRLSPRTSRGPNGHRHVTARERAGSSMRGVDRKSPPEPAAP